MAIWTKNNNISPYIFTPVNTENNSMSITGSFPVTDYTLNIWKISFFSCTSAVYDIILFSMMFCTKFMITTITIFKKSPISCEIITALGGAKRSNLGFSERTHIHYRGGSAVGGRRVFSHVSYAQSIFLCLSPAPTPAL